MFSPATAQVSTDPSRATTRIRGVLTTDALRVSGIPLGVSTTAVSSNAIWLPELPQEWDGVAPPTLTPPTGAAIAAYAHQRGVYRWTGREMVYNFSVAATLASNTASNSDDDFTLALPQPLALAAYPNGAIVGDLWLSVTSNVRLGDAPLPGSSNTFKAYARTLTGKPSPGADTSLPATALAPFAESNVAVRVLSGTADAALSILPAAPEALFTLQGTVTYATAAAAPPTTAASYIPAQFIPSPCNAAVYTLGSNTAAPAANDPSLAPAGRFHLLSPATPPTGAPSSVPALRLSQFAAAPTTVANQALRVFAASTAAAYTNVQTAPNPPALVVTRQGNVGIGTNNVTGTNLRVHGDLYFGAPAAPTEYARWSQGGLGLRKTAATTYQLDLSTANARKLSTTLWLTGSDARLKRDITPADLDQCYATVAALPLRRFQWNPAIPEYAALADRHVLGWIAQEVAPILPKSVRTSPTPEYGLTDLLILDDSQIYATMYGAVQRLIADAETTRATLADLDTRLTALGV